jgi:chloramphenicol-sensitive protein RarD
MTHAPTAQAEDDARKGLTAALIAFLIWGLFPIYLRALTNVTPLEIMVQRSVWCCVFVCIYLAFRGKLADLKQALVNPSTRYRLIATAALITVNWYVYIWGVNNNQVIETSLGYFINPLVNVLLGVAILRERLSGAQWMAVALATLGVAYLTATSGHLPWIALLLAFSFGFYGLIRKVTPVEPVTGLAAETLILLPFGLVYLIVEFQAGGSALGHANFTTQFLLFVGGAVTAIPLAAFAYGARMIRYSTIGIIQYVSPTMQFFLGVALYHEPFAGQRIIGFACIWLALIVYAGDGLWRSRKLAALA